MKLSNERSIRSLRAFAKNRKQKKSVGVAGLENLEPRQLLAADPVISEFMALNVSTIQDEDGDFSDWLEIENRGDMAVDLGGYHLTNDGSDLDKWEIPAGTNVDPGEFLVVFASGKNRVAGELHTDFTLDELGGDLLFTAADQSIITNFGTHPALGQDQSYGSFRVSAATDFVANDTNVRYLVPSDNSLGSDWTGATEPFNDGAWTEADSPIGYDTGLTASGFQVDVYKGGTIGGLGQADAAIAAGNPVGSGEFQVINFVDSEGGGGTGNYSGDSPFPGDTAADDNDFAMRATTTFFIRSDQVGPWTFGFNSDDGGRVRIDGVDVIVDDSAHAPQDFFGTINLDAGQHDIEYVFFERAGGAEAELFVAQGNHASFNANLFDLLGDPDGILPLSNLDDAIETDIEADMFNQNPSVYGRYNFNLDSPGDVTELSLDATFDDGVVVYLNGVEVHTANAPVSPTFNSTATGDTGLSSYEVNLTPHLSSLRTGNNVLAFHGLNAGSSDTEYYADATLSGRILQPYEVGVINVGTPGTTNGVIDPIINEFQADNKGTLDDEDGESSDWIEIFNPGVRDFDLTGWYLTDNPLDLTQWQFPATTIGAEEFLIVFASGKDRAESESELHTNFGLSSGGDYLALVKPDGQTVRWEYETGGTDFGPQHAGVSFGLRGGAAENPDPVPVDDDPVQGLVAYWDFEEGAGTTAADASGNGVDGTLTNMAESDWIAGRNGGTTALDFDGINDEVFTGATASDLDFAGNTQRTVAGWIKGPTSGSTNGGVFEIGSSPDNDFAVRSLANINFIWAAEFGPDFLSTTLFPAGNWMHFAVTYGSGVAEYYLNGDLKGTREVPEIATDDIVPFNIGTHNGTHFKGAIDEIAVWDVALDGTIIADLASDTLDPFAVPTGNRELGMDRDGFEVYQVKASGTFAGEVLGEVGGGANPLADVDLLLGLDAGDPGIADAATFDRTDINMWDNGGGGDTGLFGNDREFPLDDFNLDDDHFALRATGTLVVPVGQAGDFIFGVHSSDGSRLRIDGIDVIVDNSRHEPSLQTGAINLSEGTHSLELVYFEHTGAAEVELVFASESALAGQDGEFELLTILPDQQIPDVPPSVFAAPRVFFPNPTPGSENNFGVEVFVGPTILSMDHGFYEDSFELVITNDTPGADIYYTLDGTEPGPDNESAMLYNGSITIDQTTTIRAAGHMANAAPSRTATASYLFIDDILTQSPSGARPDGVPSNWNPGGTQSAWGMDPDIVNSQTWGPQMEASLTQIPSMSIVMDLEDIFGSEGIYTRASNRGRDWERPSSLELIYPEGQGPDDGFQVNAGIRVRGGFSRSNDNPKHAFRFFFRSEYGDSKLNYELFGNEGNNSFDKIDLRTSQNYSWAFQNNNNNNFLRDIYSRDLQIAMGQPSTRGEYYHLYVNGMYWGLFSNGRASQCLVCRGEFWWSGI